MATYMLHTHGDKLCRDFYDLSPDAMALAISFLRPRMEEAGITDVYPSSCNDFAIDNKIMFSEDGELFFYRDNADWSEVQYLVPEHTAAEDCKVCSYWDLKTEEDTVWAVQYMLEESMFPKAWDAMDAYDIYRAFSAQVRDIAAGHDLLFTDFGVGFHREECRVVLYPTFED